MYSTWNAAKVDHTNVNLNEVTVISTNKISRGERVDVSTIRNFTDSYIEKLRNNASILAEKIARDILETIKESPASLATYACCGISVDSLSEDLTSYTLYVDDLIGSGYAKVPYVDFTIPEVLELELSPVDLDDDFDKVYSGVPKRVLIYLVYELEELGFSCYCSDESESLFISFAI